MKNSILLLFFVLFCVNCSTVSKSNNPQNIRHIVYPDKIYNEWFLYSNGLYYKSIKEYSRAVKYFMDAATFKVSLERVYYQIADCYYHLKNYDTAKNYSQMSIKENDSFSKPYLLLHRIYLHLNDPEKAGNVLESLVKVNPELINIHYSIGLLYFKRFKNYDKSLVSFRNILELSKKISVDDFYRENAHYHIARIYYSKNIIDRSIDHFKKVIEINPDNKVTLYFLSSILMELYHLDDAKKYVTLYLSKYSGNYVINASMGRIYYLERNPMAKRYLRKAMSNDYMFGQLARSLYYELMHKDREAESDLRKLILKNPLLITPHIALGKIAIRKNDKKTALSEFFTAGIMLYKAGQFNEARIQLKKVLSINDKIPEVYFYLGKIYEESKNINLSIINFKKTNALRPGLGVQIHIGYLYSLINKFKQATEYIDMAIKMEPGNPKPYFFKGLALSRHKDFSEAEKQIKKAIDLKDDDDTYYFYLATVQEKMNKIDDTIESLRKAIKCNPKNAMVCNYLGYLYAEMNINIDESIELIQKALILSPLNGAYLDSLGWAYYKKGKFKIALNKLLQAERQLEKDRAPDPVVFDHIGDAYKKIGNINKAVKYWRKSVDLKKNQKIEKKIENLESD